MEISFKLQKGTRVCCFSLWWSSRDLQGAVFLLFVHLSSSPVFDL